MDFAWPGFLGLSRAERAFICGDVAGLCEQLKALFPEDPDAARVEDLVRFTLGDTPPPRSTSETAPIFFESMSKTKGLLSRPRCGSRQRQSRRVIGPHLDFIGGGVAAEYWTIAQCLNYLLINRLRPTRRAAVVVPMRDDGIYILEFIAYYLTLGFEHVFIYTNDNSDGSEVLLRLLADHNIITLIESETTGTVLPTMKAYEHAVHLLHELREFVWVLFVDSDEYFFAPGDYDHSVINVLAALVERFPDQLPSAICYHWLWFISGMAYQRTPGLLMERFQHATPHTHTKALVRLHDLISMRPLHYPEVKAHGFLVDSAFDRIPLDAMRVWDWREPQYKGGRINHYWTRSFEEFAVKVARSRSLNLENNVYRRPYKLFFLWNDLETPENHYPAAGVLLARVKQKLKELEQLEGIGAAASQIDRDFPLYLKSHFRKRSVRSLYQHTRMKPVEH